MKTINLFYAILKRDLIIAYRQPIELLNPVLFFILVTLLFPLTMTSDPQRLMQMGPGVIWIALLLASLLSIENIFSEDFKDGTLEQIALCPQPLAILVLAKIFVHWLITALPLLITSIIFSNFFFLQKHVIIILLLSLLLGSPVLIMVGAIGSALTFGLRNRGIILILLTLPLNLPVIIFGTSAVNDASSGLPVMSQLAFLGAFLTLSFTLAPFAISAAIRIGLE